MEAFRTAYVYIRHTFACELKETDAGYSFTYDPTYLDSADAGAVSLLKLRRNCNLSIISEQAGQLLPDHFKR